ncbi:uncharacterized protein EI97DRAFT_456981 [Westerdykella ornata]|uniref:Uncharacterized protein n=1 Tax=Westerdykella ornata TaxID=318751 RepID=A0A6A6JM34_WESOR|nr:uncharacterized protein EI97DRAFT_456981 [Westerdykella ornata]KAF2277730.1 hypothetical protein EI97DRAFT_456981 [Westerdykella ornata]
MQSLFVVRLPTNAESVAALPGDLIDVIHDYAFVIDIPKNFKYEKKSGLNIAAGADVAEMVKFKVAWSSNKTKIVAAKSARKVELKDSEDFFYNQVLQNQKARERLNQWISEALSAKGAVIRQSLRRKPRIWLLKGLYTFEDATSTVKINASLGVDAGISSLLVLAVGGPPIGPEVGILVDRSVQSTLPMAGELVWAAQWQLLDLEDLRYGEDIPESNTHESEPPNQPVPRYLVPRSTKLHGDRFSRGVLLNAGDGEKLVFLALGKEFLDEKDVPRLAETMGVSEAAKLVERDNEQEKAEAQEFLRITNEMSRGRPLQKRKRKRLPKDQGREQAALRAEQRVIEEFHQACEYLLVVLEERDAASKSFSERIMRPATLS